MKLFYVDRQKNTKMDMRIHFYDLKHKQGWIHFIRMFQLRHWSVFKYFARQTFHKSTDRRW